MHLSSRSSSTRLFNLRQHFKNFSAQETFAGLPLFSSSPWSSSLFSPTVSKERVQILSCGSSPETAGASVRHTLHSPPQLFVLFQTRSEIDAEGGGEGRSRSCDGKPLRECPNVWPVGGDTGAEAPAEFMKVLRAPAGSKTVDILPSTGGNDLIFYFLQSEEDLAQ